MSKRLRFRVSLSQRNDSLIKDMMAQRGITYTKALEALLNSIQYLPPKEKDA